MPVDIQVTHPQALINLSQVTVVQGPPLMVAVRGDDFRAVDQVLINQTPSQEVVVLNKNQLLARVPITAVQEQVLSVVVVSKRLTLSARSQLKFRLGKTPGRVTGILRLMQFFLKILFTTPGRDIFSPNLGGGALKNIGATFGAGQSNDLVNDFFIAVDTTSRQITALQGRDVSVPRDERLLSATVTSAVFNESMGGIDATIRLISQAGAEATANIGL